MNLDGRFFRERRGQGVVEFALAVPIFLVLVLGIFDIGRVVWYSNTLALATQEGARYAIVHGASCACGTQAAITTQIQSVVVRNAQGVSGLTTSAVSVSYPDGSFQAGQRVTVSVPSLTFTPLASQYFLGGSLQLALEASATMVIRQ